MNGKENKSSKLLRPEDFLGDGTDECASKLVIKNDGRGPYYNFMAPVEGILQYSKRADIVLRDRKAAPIVYRSEPSRGTSSSSTGKKGSQALGPSSNNTTDTATRKTPVVPTATRVVIPPKEEKSKST